MHLAAPSRGKRMRVTVLILLAGSLGAGIQAQSYDDLFHEAAELSAQRNFDGAIEKIRAALQQRPGAPEALSNLGVIYHLAGRYREAVETMEVVVRSNPKLFPDYPFHADILSALQNASVRPQTPLYQVVSIDLSHLISPPSAINPQATEQSMVGQINNALQSNRRGDIT